MQLPVAYRSLSRPSSAPDAKAFPLRSFQLDLFGQLIAVLRIMQASQKFLIVVTLIVNIHNLRLRSRLREHALCCLAS